MNNNVQKYEVGQILFVLAKEIAKVFSIQIVEEVIHKKLGGENITYLFVTPESVHKNKMYTLSKLKGDIFCSPEEAEAEMLRRAGAGIKEMISAAKDQALVFTKQPEDDHPEQLVEPPPMEPEKIIEVIKDVSLNRPVEMNVDSADVELVPTSTVIELPDGRLAKINVVN